jgi:hypothetical protein
MSKRIFKFSAASFVVLVLLVAPVAARTTWTEFTGISAATSPGSGGRMWVSDGVIHIRDYQVETTFDATDDRMDGTLVNTFNANWHLVEGLLFPGHGRMWGTVLITNDDGHWDCSYTGERTKSDYYTYIRSVCHGYGDYEGLQARMNLVNETPNPDAQLFAHGVIMDPGGE